MSVSFAVDLSRKSTLPEPIITRVSARGSVE